ncbi:hypothetical protein JHK85_048236 [Glycine max]|nr:hypothetical protein JHK85_048236 [Glycine max]
MGVSDVGRRKRFRVIFNVLARKKFDSSFICLSPKVGYLVPLNRHFKEQALVSNFAVSDVINVTSLESLDLSNPSSYQDLSKVLYHLVRVEPFTTLAIKLQGGKFDHSDLMFSNISATWNGVLKGMSDVKELVPNLFYLPEVLTNENSVDFGTTQLGEKLGILIKIFCTSIGWLWRNLVYA